MKKKSKIIIGSSLAGVIVLGAVAATAGPVIYRDLIVGEAEQAPTLETKPSSSATSTATDADLDGQWDIGSGSFAGYRVDEVLNGTDVTVVGRTEEVSGTLSIEDENLTDAEITVDVASISTDSSRRDDYFHNTTMSVGEFPTATFTLSDSVDIAALSESGANTTVPVEGELTLAGTTQPVTLELEAVIDGESGQAVGQIPVTFADFGIDAPDLGFVKVEDQGVIEFSVNLERS